MAARIVDSMIVSVGALIVVSLSASSVMLLWTSSPLASAFVGTLCGLAAACVVDALRVTVRRYRNRPGAEKRRPDDGGWIAEREEGMNEQ